ncbi:MAG: hypothetical protein ACRDRI_19500 [Pseudonocardiaceae bacterium]
MFWHSVHFLLLLASGLTLTPQGVELKRWQTTMTPSKEIQSVQTGSAYGVKTVEFVLSGRSELSRVPGHAVAIPDREFDQKL